MAMGPLGLLAVGHHGETKQGPPGSSRGGVCCCLMRLATETVPVVIEAGSTATSENGGSRGGRQWEPGEPGGR